MTTAKKAPAKKTAPKKPTTETVKAVDVPATPTPTVDAPSAAQKATKKAQHQGIVQTASSAIATGMQALQEPLATDAKIEAYDADGPTLADLDFPCEGFTITGRPVLLCGYLPSYKLVFGEYLNSIGKLDYGAWLLTGATTIKVGRAHRTANTLHLPSFGLPMTGAMMTARQHMSSNGRGDELVDIDATSIEPAAAATTTDED